MAVILQQVARGVRLAICWIPQNRWSARRRYHGRQILEFSALALGFRVEARYLLAFAFGHDRYLPEGF
jgi:hypothetical protein